MAELAWLEAIKEAYMADRASVFLLHGPGTRAQWTLDDLTDDFVDVLVHFLSRTREVVGLYDPPQALRLPGIGDRGRFDNLISAAFLVSGTHIALAEDQPGECLAKLWIALSDRATPQGYVIGAIETIYPGHRPRLIDLANDTPHLWEWAVSDRIRKSNHIVLLVADNLENVRDELVSACETVEVPHPRKVAALPDTGDEAFHETQVPNPLDEEPTLESPTEMLESELAEPPPAPTGDVDLEALASDLNSAIRAALATHDESTRPSKLPVMAAVAQILGERRGAPGALTWSLDEDGKAIPSGDGAEDFLALWRSDIALDASAGMLIGKLGQGIPDQLDGTGLRALAKRISKKLR